MTSSVTKTIGGVAVGTLLFATSLSVFALGGGIQWHPQSGQSVAQTGQADVAKIIDRHGRMVFLSESGSR